MRRYLSLLLFIGLAFWSCEDNDDYDPRTPFSEGRFNNGLKYTKYDLRFDESQDRYYEVGDNHYSSLKSELFVKGDGGSFYRTRASGDHYYGLPFTFPNGITVQLNFNDWELTDYGNWLTDLDHSCTEEMWNGEYFTLASFDPIYLTDKEKEDIKLLYDTEPGTIPDWKPSN